MCLVWVVLGSKVLDVLRLTCVVEFCCFGCWLVVLRLCRLVLGCGATVVLVRVFLVWVAVSLLYFMTVSNMVFGAIVFLSLSWVPLEAVRWMQNLSNVFSIGPFAAVCSIVMHSSIGRNGCLFFRRWLA